MRVQLELDGRAVGLGAPTYFIADIASNHDGSLQRAIDLIHAAAQAGADAVKFQHFLAEKIVSDRGFRDLAGQLSHQASWPKPVFDVYRDYELDRGWTSDLAAAADSAGVDFLTTPYDYEAVDGVAALVPAFKIGSGDVTWLQLIEYVARQGRPVILATGASDMGDVERAVATVLAVNPQLVLLQCNTNYTGSLQNLQYVNLRVLSSFAQRWPELVLGLSDHTPTHATVLGAITLGARMIEKHFTDDRSRQGPDHSFSLDPPAWREMVERSRELEAALGDGVKRVEDNERETAVIQRRSLRAARRLMRGSALRAADVDILRPAEPGALPPYQLTEVVGLTLRTDKEIGEPFLPQDFQ